MAPMDEQGPDPGTAGTPADYAACLLALKKWSGRSFRGIAAAARKAGHEISDGTPENLTSGRVAPQEKSVIGFLHGCGVTERGQQRLWLTKLAEIHPRRIQPKMPSAPVGFDIDAYLTELDQLFDESGIAEWSVPLTGYTEPQNIDVSVEAYIEEWLQRPTRRPLAVLGDYGTGKSWLCLRVAKNLADSYRRDKSRPLPLLISFKRFEPEMDLEQLVRSHMFDGYGVEVKNPATLRRALRSGRVLPILDGLDEMASSLGERTALVAYSRLGLASGIPRALITCRTHYFYSGAEQRELLAPTVVLPDFDLLHLRMLGWEAVQECVRRRFEPAEAESVLRFVASTYNLTELCARPVLLSLVCQSHEHLAELGAAATSADLYEAYAHTWLDRELSDGRLILAPDLVNIFFEDLADDMLSLQTLRVDLAYLKDRLTALLARASLSPQRWRDVERQLITSTFVSRTYGDSWQFAHRSFQEYFYARKFFRWEEESAGNGSFPVVYTPIWQFIAQMALRRWDEPKARHWIKPRIPRQADRTLTRTTLRAAAAYWLLKNRCRDFPLAGVMLDSVDLAGIDLSGRDLTASDLHGSDLSGANLSGASLRSCDLVGARLTDCDITYTDFRGASFSGESPSDELKRCPGYDLAIFD